MNAEPTFTPGPWFRVWNGHFHDICKEEREYAQSLGSTHVNGPLGIGTAEARANARLIAAAPDLFHALKSLLDDCEEYSRINKLHNEDGSPATNHSMRWARAALSKANPVQS